MAFYCLAMASLKWWLYDFKSNAEESDSEEKRHAAIVFG